MRGTLCRLAALHFRGYKSISLVILLCLLGNVASVAAQSYSTATGIPSFAAPEPVEMGFADAANGRLHLVIHLGSYPQRGTGQPEDVSLIYDSDIWTVNSTGVWDPSNTLSIAGWNLSEDIQARRTSNGPTTGCRDDEAWQDRNGTVHVFPLQTNPWANCTYSGGAYASDSSGFWMKVFSCQNALYGCLSVYAPDGTLAWTNDIYSGNFTDPSGHYIISKDSNGNYLSTDTTTGSSRTVWDTLGRVVSAPNYVVPTSRGTSQYQIVWATIPLNTHFQRSGVPECPSPACTTKVIQSITLPDAANSTYHFKYDCDSGTGNAACGSPSGQTYYYGEMVSATLPTGSQVTYQWTMFKDSYNNNTRWLSSRYGATYTSFTPAVISTCGSGSVGCQQKNTVAYSDGSRTIYTFTLNNGAWPVQIQKLDSNTGNVLSTTKNTYDFSVACPHQNCVGAGYIRLLTTQTTIPTPGGSSLTKQTSYSYDSPQTGNITAVKEWKFLSGTSPSFPSVPDRTTYTSYLTTGTNDINRPSKVTICNNWGSDTTNCPGGGSRVSQTIITYDSYSSCPSGLKSVPTISHHDDTNFGTAYLQRGNPTQIQHWVSGSTFLNTQVCYDTTGQVYQSSDPAGNLTTYDYTDNFFTETGSTSMSTYTPSAPTNAYPKTVSSGTLTATYGYYFGSGKNAITTDPNNQQSSFFLWDGLDRSTQDNYPIGWRLTNYTSAIQADAYAPVADAAASSSCTSCQHQQFNYDGWGRVANEKLVNDPSGATNVDTYYDGNGRVSWKSHAYHTTSDPTYVFEKFSYDGLNRTTGVNHPDNQWAYQAYGANIGNLAGVTTQQSSAATYGYGYPTISLDETGKQRQQWVDGFGKIIEVDEPSANAASPGKGSLTVSGSEQSVTLDPCEPIGAGSCPYTVYDSGSVSVVINGFTAAANYGSTDTAASVAASLSGALNSASSPVTAAVNGTTVSMTAKGSGTSTNYTFSSSSTYNTSNFNYPSFTATSGSLTGGSGGISASPLETSYVYDVLGNLTQVVQGVQPPRTFTYDGLGRLTARTTPETGSESFSYVNSSGAVCAGNPKALCSKVDARGVTTTYSYDSHSRLLGKVYTIPHGSSVASIPPLCVPVGTSLPPQNVCYNYDQGGAAAFALGRLTQVQYSINYQSIGSDTYTYDAGGRMTQVQTAFGGMNWTTKYGYDAGGKLTSTTYPSGRVVTQNLDSVGRLSGVTDGTTNYTSNFSYNAAQQVTGFSIGNGLAASFGYDPLSTMMNCLDYSSTSRSGNCVHDTTTKFGLSYYYQHDASNCAGGTSGNNGQINCIVDNTPDSGMDLGHEGRSIGYSYDALGRLLTAKTTGSTQYPQWGLGFTYDRYGNRLNQSVTAGSAPSNSLSFATTPAPPTNPPGGAYTNRPDGYSFDPSGNMLNDGYNTLTYDAENHVITNTNSATGTTTYYYDGHGQRIAKWLTNQTGPITVYVFANGTDIAEYGYENPITQPTVEYIYSGGKLAATVAGSTKAYPLSDHLSVRMTTDTSGNKIGEQGHFPFGESWYASSTTSKFIFTSYERDSESGNDYARDRFYINRFARFCSADPVMGRPSDPQSWNGYSYVRNDPGNKTDPSGDHPFSWLVNFFKFIMEFITDYPHAPGLGVTWAWGTPPIFDSDPLSDTSATLGSLYNPQDPSKFIIDNFQQNLANVQLDALGPCIKDQFSVVLESFIQSKPGTSGSFSGVKAGIYTGPRTQDASGPYEFSVSNDVVSKNTGTLTFYDRLANPDLFEPGEVAEGFTNQGNPFKNFTGNNVDPTKFLKIQIQELGNSLAFITHTNPGKIKQKDRSDEPGAKLLECYTQRGGLL